VVRRVSGTRYRSQQTHTHPCHFLQAEGGAGGSREKVERMGVGVARLTHCLI